MKSFRTVLKIYSLSVLVVIIWFVALGLTTVLASEANQSCKPDFDTIIISTPVPGMNLTYNPYCQGYEFKGDLSDYIVILYRFFVGIAGIIAVFMIVFGGVQWLFAGGSADGISNAKETIVGAVVGLILALGSYTILYIINPQLTNFANFKERVKPVQFASEAWYNEDGSCKLPSELPCGAYCQPLARAGGSGNNNQAVPVIGSCDWCRPSSDSNDDNEVSCGSSLKDPFTPVAGGNCFYAECEDDAACIYITQPNTYASPGSIFKPYCGDRMQITGNGGNFEYLFGDSNFCGKIVNTQFCYQGECSVRHRKIGTDCPGNENCVIDISRGYRLTRPMDQDGVIGEFNTAICVN